MRECLIRNKRILFLFFLALFAFIVRIFRFNPEIGFISSDDAYVALASLDLFNITGTLDSVLIHGLRFFSFGWGYMRLLVTAVEVFIAQLFGLQVTEFTLVFPQIILGTTTCVLVYLLTEELFDESTAKVSSILFAITPIAITASRTIYNTANTSIFILLLFLLTFIKYLKYDKHKLISPIFLGIYLSSDNQFISIFPLLVCLIYKYKHKLFKALPFRFFAIALLAYAPAILPFLYFLIVKHRIDGGIIAHNLLRSKIIGFHPEIFTYLIYSLGLLLFILSAIAIIYCIWTRERKKNNVVILIWASSYLLPWFFLITPALIGRPYFLPSVIPLIILSSQVIIGFFRAPLNKIVKISIFTIILFGIFNHTVYTTYKLDTRMPPTLFDSGSFGIKYFYGDYRTDNWGTKTAGYWIRNNTSENVTLFTDVGIPVAKYYFHRKVLADPSIDYGVNISTSLQKSEFLIKMKPEIDVVVLFEKSLIFFNNTALKGFEKIVEVTQDNVTKINIYKKSTSANKTKIYKLDVQQYDRIFDNDYANTRSLKVDCYFCV